MTRPQSSAATVRMEAPDQLVLDRYRLERRLGAGGFGVVWQAWDEKLERDVAVKVIPREDGDERADREARAAARLNHPGIVALYELGADESDFFLVSELVPGRTLAELTRAKALADRDVARIGIALCEALEHAHSRGVIHRDVKPQNVMVLAEPAAGAGFAKLTDFGVAHLASGDRVTRTGDVVGTLAYMAPEQAEGRAVSPESDVYSLALTLFEAWTGANPVRAASPAATARRVGRRLPALGSKRRDLPRRAVRGDRRGARPRSRDAPEPPPAAGGAAPGGGPALGGGRPRRARDAGALRPHPGHARARRAPALTLPRARGRGSLRRGPGGRRLRGPGPAAGVLGAGRGGGHRGAGGAASARGMDRRRPGSLRLAGVPRVRRARRWSWPRRSRRCRSCCRGRGRCGRCPPWRPCSAPSRSPRRFPPSPPWPGRPGAGRGWPPPASSGSPWPKF